MTSTRRARVAHGFRHGARVLLLRVRIIAACGLAALLLSTAPISPAPDHSLHPFLTYLPSSGPDARPAFDLGYGPQDFVRLYHLPAAPPPAARPQLIALVAYGNDPHIARDLSVYSAVYDLPACPLGTCLTVMNEKGGKPVREVDPGWALEESMDVEISHGLCPTCKLLLVEARHATARDLGQAVDTAVQRGATEVNNSYGGAEGSQWYTAGTRVKSADVMYHHPGVAVVAAAGDEGYGVSFPASVSTVVAVGGTTLSPDGTETVWSGTGSGCSSVQRAAWWQKNFAPYHDAHCNGYRAVNDVSADANPHTGAEVFDSLPVFWDGTLKHGWWEVGGTSLSSPIWSSVFALMGGVPSGIEAPIVLYDHPRAFHAITAGKNKRWCRYRARCAASKVGWSSPTGLGSPDGVEGFAAN